MTWSEYVEKHGQEEYRAWDAAVKPLTDRIAELEAEVAELRKDRARLEWALRTYFKASSREEVDAAMGDSV